MSFRNVRERLLYNAAHFAVQRISQAVMDHAPQMIDDYFQGRQIQQHQAEQAATVVHPRPYFPRPAMHAHPHLRNQGPLHNPFVQPPPRTGYTVKPVVPTVVPNAIVELDENGEEIEGSEIPLP